LGYDNGTQGMGLLLGKPSGFRYTYWLGWKRAIFGDLVYDFDGLLITQGSYAFYFFNAKDQLKKKKGFNSFLFYLAPGAIAGTRVSGTDTSSYVVLGLRGVGGMEYVFGRGDWSMRAELGANVNLMGRTFADFQGILGLTYYFDRGSSGQRRSRAKTNSTDDEFSEFD